MKFGELKAASVFKLIFLSALTCFFIMALIFGVMAVYGADTVRINGRAIYGIAALPASLMIGVVISLFFSAVSTAGFLLLRFAFPRLAINSRADRREAEAP